MNETEQAVAIHVAHTGLIGALLEIVHEVNPDALPAYLARLRRADARLTTAAADDIQRTALRIQIDAVEDAIRGV